MAVKLPNLRLVQAARAAEVVLLAIVVILHAAGWFTVEYLKALGTPGSLLAESLPFASLSLLALWIPLGPGPLWLRGAASPLLAWLIYQAANSHGPTDWTLADKLLASVAGCLFTVALILRMGGVRVITNPPRLDDKAPQFSVRGLLIVTTLVALCVGGLEAARPWLVFNKDRPFTDEAELDAILDGTLTKDHFDLNWPEYLAWINLGRPRQALMSVVLIATSLLGGWSAMRPGTPWLRCAGSVACVCAMGLYLGQLTGLDRESTLTMTVWVANIGLVVGVSIAPLRLMGYRVVRPCIAATRGRAESKPIPGSAGASPSRPALAESHL